jgi:glycerol-3-phosphate dehydrogenase (NAD(P)+)
LALLLYNNGHHVGLWSWDKVHVEQLMRDGENKTFLPGVPLPADLLITPHISGVASADMVVFAVPSHAVPSVAAQAKEFIRREAVVVNVGKGFDPQGRRLSEVINEVLPHNPYVTLSGPSHAEEVARNKPTTVVVAAADLSLCHRVQDVFMNNDFRVYTNQDLIGVEICGAVKNIIALGVGVIEGLGLGDNAKAALITRGLAEIMRLGVTLGASPTTFAGLAGVGDLVVTCTSHHSRNFRAGIEIGKGRPWNQVVEEMCMVVEGVFATESTYKLARKHQVDMPITEQIYYLLYEGRTPQEAMWALMTRSKAAGEIML